MRSTLHDEYQDGTSAGSLASARTHWLELRTSHALLKPQRFSFAFACPSPRVAEDLARFLAHESRARLVTSADEEGARTDPWRVAGTTAPALVCLACLEELFMGLRQAARRFNSSLVTLDLAPGSAASAPGV